jgi:hypothetical protein
MSKTKFGKIFLIVLVFTVMITVFLYIKTKQSDINYEEKPKTNVASKTVEPLTVSSNVVSLSPPYRYIDIFGHQLLLGSLDDYSFLLPNFEFRKDFLIIPAHPTVYDFGNKRKVDMESTRLIFSVLDYNNYSILQKLSKHLLFETDTESYEMPKYSGGRELRDTECHDAFIISEDEIICLVGNESEGIFEKIISIDPKTQNETELYRTDKNIEDFYFKNDNIYSYEALRKRNGAIEDNTYFVALNGEPYLLYSSLYDGNTQKAVYKNRDMEVSKEEEVWKFWFFFEKNEQVYYAAYRGTDTKSFGYFALLEENNGLEIQLVDDQEIIFHTE